MLNVDFDGTLNSTESALEIARLAGKEEDAKKVYQSLLDSYEKIVEESPTSQLIRDVVETHKRHLKEGAYSLKGSPSTILSEIVCQPSCYFHEIIERAKDQGGLKIITYNDRRVVENFVKKNDIPNCDIICSELEVVDGKLTGNFLKIVSKCEGFTEGDVVGDSLGDLELFKRAHEEGYRGYVAKNGRKSILLEKALKKCEIPYLDLNS